MRTGLGKAQLFRDREGEGVIVLTIPDRMALVWSCLDVSGRCFALRSFAWRAHLMVSRTWQIGLALAKLQSHQGDSIQAAILWPLLPSRLHGAECCELGIARESWS